MKCKFLKNKDIVITDYGISIMWGEYFVNMLNYETGEEIPEIKTFKTKEEFINCLNKHGINEKLLLLTMAKNIT